MKVLVHVQLMKNEVIPVARTKVGVGGKLNNRNNLQNVASVTAYLFFIF